MDTYTVNNANEQVFEGACGALPFVKIDGVRGLSVGATFDCGQAFRFDPVKDSRHECEFSGVAYGRAVSFAKDGDTLYIYNSTAEEYYSVWKRYLGLHLDYAKINEDILSRSDEPALKNAVRLGDGIRILSQEPWETVCSFIISQNNNIPRIKKIINAMSARLGDPIDVSAMTGHLSESMKGGAFSFPSAQSIMLAGEGVLSELRTGFRAKYIYDAARRVSGVELDLDGIKSMKSTDEAAKELMSVKGIGPKVAACALLFGFERYDAFPVDVWIKKVMAKYFPSCFDACSLGEYAGIAQQYLFYYERYMGGER